MDKNVVWAVVLSTLVLVLWYRFFPPRPPIPAPIQAVSGSSAASGVLTGGAIQKTTGGGPVLKERIIETDFARIVLDSRGGAIKHWWVRDEKQGNKAAALSGGTPFVGPDLVDYAGRDSLDPEQMPLSTFPELNFTETVTRGGPQCLWKAVLPGGVQVEKEYALEEGNQSRFLHLTLSFRNPGKSSMKVEGFQVGWKEGLGTVKSEQEENRKVTRVLAYPSPTREVVNFKKPAQEKMEYAWVGVDNRYFLLAFLPKRGQFDHIIVDKSKQNRGEAYLSTDGFTLNPGEAKAFELRIYGGPKGYTYLKKLGVGLEHAVDFGYFGFLGKWALKAMNTLHRMTGNYGWAIIILTGMLQLIVMPLSFKSFKSMAAMKKLQPKIQDLQNRYKDDPKRMNQEMLSLYRDSKTNPFGGCLPMLLQIPVFWAFFTMLRNSYELRGAPWIFWIHDLSQKDPHYVLPVVMGGGMLLQQKMSGGSGDPAQAKMMMMMPIVFTFLFLKFPSGLVLYWLTNSILSMGTQYFINRKINSPGPLKLKSA